MSEEANDNFEQAATIQLVAALQFENSMTGLSAVVKELGIQTRSTALGFAKLGSIIANVGAMIPKGSSTMGKKLKAAIDPIEQSLVQFLKGVVQATAGTQQLATTTKQTAGIGGLLGPLVESFKTFGTSTKFGRAGTSILGKPKFRSGLLGGGVGGVAKGLGQSLMGGLATLGPQMLALTLIMKPISALLEGLLEPLEPLIDLFGMVGEIIGLLLVPIVKALMDVLLPFMPLLLEIVVALMPLIKLMVLPITLLGDAMTAIIPIFTGIVKLVGDLISFLNPIIDFVTGFADMLSSGIGNLITNFFGAASSHVQSWVQWIGNLIDDKLGGITNNIRESLDDAVDSIKFWKR